MSVLETTGLVKRYGRRAVLDGLDLVVPDGSVTALLGRNGIGKTTLLRILIGFQPATSGSARVLGLDPRRHGPRIRRLVGFVPERLELPRWMRVRDHLRFLRPFYPSWDRDEEARLLELFSLDPKAKLHRMSKGERTRHALLAALAHRPSLLLLDEPFSGLDPSARADVLSAVLDHLRDEGRTVLLASHSLPDVERVADRVVLVESGKVALEGDLEEVRRRTVRLQVTLAASANGWRPPGRPVVERAGEDVVLTYLEWRDEHEAALRADPAVTAVRRLGRDLGDVFLAALRREEEPCVV
jgi:ABC-2 type transport system ATP-binding protein